MDGQEDLSSLCPFHRVYLHHRQAGLICHELFVIEVSAIQPTSHVHFEGILFLLPSSHPHHAGHIDISRGEDSGIHIAI